jgi:hypothetical protein
MARCPRAAGARRYAPGEVVVSENGVDDPGEAALGLPDALHDAFRVGFFRDYVQAAADAATLDRVCALACRDQSGMP